MKFYDSSIVNQARKARKNGSSLREIEKKLHVSSSTVSTWVRDIKSKDPIFNNSRLFEKENKKTFIYLFNHLKINKNWSRILVSILYWCEGSKYPASNCIAFTNSDPTMMKTFLSLLRKAFHIDEAKLRIRLQLHSTHKITQENTFWSKLLDIPIGQFGKPTITYPTNKMKRVSYRGTCTIKYYDVKLQLQIIGLYEAFSQQYYLGGVR